MAKRTKFSKFRELYNVIEDLADTYTYEGVVEILAEHHDLKLTIGTLTNYLYRHRKELSELSVATDNFGSQDKNSIEQQKVEPVTEDQETVQPEPPKNKEVASAVSSEEDDKPPALQELKAALEDMKKQVEIQENRSLFDRKATDTVSIERTEIEKIRE